MPRVNIIIIIIIIIIRTLRFQVAGYMKLVHRELNSWKVFLALFFMFPMKVARVYLDSSCGKFPALGPWWQPCKYFYTINSKVEVCAMIGGFFKCKIRGWHSLEKSLNSIFPWKVLKSLCKFLKVLEFSSTLNVVAWKVFFDCFTRTRH